MSEQVEDDCDPAKLNMELQHRRRQLISDVQTLGHCRGAIGRAPTRVCSVLIQTTCWDDRGQRISALHVPVVSAISFSRNSHSICRYTVPFGDYLVPLFAKVSDRSE